MATDQGANKDHEPVVLRDLAEQKLLKVDNFYMKRSLRRHEWHMVGPNKDFPVEPPATMPQLFRNEAAVVEFIRENTNIPLPPQVVSFEEDGAVYLKSEKVEGVFMHDLSEDDKQTVILEVEQHVATLRSLKSDTAGIPGGGLSCAPHRVLSPGFGCGFWKMHSCWRGRTKGEYVFCHNDLGHHNVIVDPETLKINAIIGWQMAGFYPEWFEKELWKRPGHSGLLEGDVDDTDRLRQWLVENCDEVVMEHIS